MRKMPGCHPGRAHRHAHQAGYPAGTVGLLGLGQRHHSNRCKHLLTQGTKEWQIPEDEEGNSMLDNMETLDDQTVPDKAVDNAETQRLILDIIDGLPAEQRMTVTFFYYDEMSVKEIATAMEVSEGTVKSRLNYARKAIKEGVEKLAKSGTKLYGISPLPFLSYFLRAGAASQALPSAALAGTLAVGGIGGGVYLATRQAEPTPTPEPTPTAVMAVYTPTPTPFDTPEPTPAPTPTHTYITDSGMCGENVRWTYDGATQTLVISGSGDMESWSVPPDVPWAAYQEDIKSIVIENGVTNIGTLAFGKCVNVTSVIIPDSVTRIVEAFANCPNLTIHAPVGITAETYAAENNIPFEAI